MLVPPVAPKLEPRATTGIQRILPVVRMKATIIGARVAFTR